MTFRQVIRLDAQQWRYTSFIGMLLTSVALIVLAQNYYKHAGSEAYSVGLSLVYNLIVYASFALFISLIVRISEQMSTTQLNKASWVALHLLISIGLVLVHMMLCNLTLYAIGLSSSPVFPRFLTKYLTNVVHVHLLVYWAVVVIKTLNRSQENATTMEAEADIKPELLTRFVVNQRGRTIYVSFDQVYWIEALDHYQKLHTADGYHLIKDSMKNLESVLPSQHFQRAHRSYIVNVDKVTSISRNTVDRKGNQVHLSNGTELKLGNAYVSRFNK